MPKKIIKSYKSFNFLRPQLAKTATDKVINSVAGSSKWVAEMKLDGHRLLLGDGVAWSRIGKDVANMGSLGSVIPEGVLLDGELLPLDGEEGSHLVSTLRADDPEALKFVAFDILYNEGVYVGDKTWAERREILKSVVESVESPRLELSVIYSLNETSVEDLMNLAAERGHEGIMLKKVDAPYKENSRSAWVKHKFTDTHDVVIVDCDAKPSEWRVRPGEVGTDGVLYPNGLHTDPWVKGYVGLNYGFYDKQGNLRIVGSLGETGPREVMEQHVGKVAEIKGYGQYPTGAIRHPVLLCWREDKLPEDCVFDF
jgi:bifunctional non-homologous end joining protein LigD